MGKYILMARFTNPENGSVISCRKKVVKSEFLPREGEHIDIPNSLFLKEIKVSRVVHPSLNVTFPRSLPKVYIEMASREDVISLGSEEGWKKP
jgi:hypothetical protein